MAANGVEDSEQMKRYKLAIVVIVLVVIVVGAGIVLQQGRGPVPLPEESLAEMHQSCGEGDSCPAGLECVSYYGILGPQGPEFKTCEIRCRRGDGCPQGLFCTTIADGPGEVCSR